MARTKDVSKEVSPLWALVTKGVEKVTEEAEAQRQARKQLDTRFWYSTTTASALASDVAELKRFVHGIVLNSGKAAEFFKERSLKQETEDLKALTQEIVVSREAELAKLKGVREQIIKTIIKNLHPYVGGSRETWRHMPKGHTITLEQMAKEVLFKTGLPQKLVDDPSRDNVLQYFNGTYFTYKDLEVKLQLL